ncbi:MAG: undecaprenyl-diphosphate phosphatase [Planctomycetaceae bacterium]
MDYLKTILLGLVQGIAEFLPISSSGHLAILNRLMATEMETVELNVALHFGTLMSILVVFRKDWPQILRNRRICLAVIVATLPLVLVGPFVKKLVEDVSTSPLWAGCGLLVTSVLLFLIPKVEQEQQPLETISLRSALTVGLFQVIAPLPGVSRSGTTIFGGLLSGLNRDAAARFSFLIAIPAILGAVVLKAKDMYETGGEGTPVGPLVVGTLVAFLVGVASLKWLLKMISSRKLIFFAWYCLIVGAATILWQLLLPEAAPLPS